MTQPTPLPPDSPQTTIVCHKCGHPYCTDATAFTIGALHTITKTHICPDTTITP